jgi:hypothetical protein
MNARLNGWFVVALIAGAILSSATLAFAGNGEKGALSPAPPDEPQLKVGSTLVIAGDGANLIVGSHIVAALPKGQRIVVVEVRDPWVGTYVSVNGQKRAGWIATADFVPVSSPVKPGPKIYTAAESTVSEPTANAVHMQTRNSACSSSPDYFTDYNIGYYQRHETDPNIHTWEPWMSR